MRYWYFLGSFLIAFIGIPIKYDMMWLTVIMQIIVISILVYLQVKSEITQPKCEEEYNKGLINFNRRKSR